MVCRQHRAHIAASPGNFRALHSVVHPIGQVMGQAKQPTDKEKLAQEKRDLARRARGLAQAQLDPHRSRLTRFAAHLEQEAEARLPTGMSKE